MFFEDFVGFVKNFETKDIMGVFECFDYGCAFTNDI